MKRAGKLLGAFFERNNIQDTQGYVDFFQSWEKIVGVDLAAHSDAVDIRNHALIVEVDHPGWMQKLHMQRERVLRTLQQRYPNLGIRNIHFTLVEEGRLGSKEQRSGGRTPGTDSPAPSEPPGEKERATFLHPDSAEPSPEERERERREEPQPSRNEKEALKNIGSERLRERLESLGRHIHQREEEDED
jgi:hypothetical protein